MKNIIKDIPIAFLVLDKSFDNENDFKKEVNYNIATKLYGCITDLDFPEKCFIFTKEGIYASIENNKISKLSKSNTNNWVFFKN